MLQSANLKGRRPLNVAARNGAPDVGRRRAAARRVRSGRWWWPAAARAGRISPRSACPVITTVNGKGVLDERHPLSLGASIRLRAAQRFLAEADVVLAIGTELGESDLWGDDAGAAAR